jgi:hypothetical protein
LVIIVYIGYNSVLKNVCMCASFWFNWKCSSARKCLTVFCPLIPKVMVSSTLGTFQCVIMCICAGLLLDMTVAKGVRCRLITEDGLNITGLGKTIHCMKTSSTREWHFKILGRKKDRFACSMRQKFKSYHV